jgi:predicted kinase
MNTLYLYYGLPGSGKSTKTNELGLEQHSVSMDAVRALFHSVTVGHNGNLGLNNKDDNKTYSIFMDALESRMNSQSSLIVDNTNLYKFHTDGFVKLAELYNYTIKIVDFSDVPMKVIWERNDSRPVNKRLNPKQLQKMIDYVNKSTPVTEWGFEVITPDQMNQEMKSPIDSFLVDLNGYKKIHHIGDLQGCYKPLEDYIDDAGGLKNDEYYIFVGDLIDRGIENHKVVEYVRSIMYKDNVTLIRGNHENHIERYARRGKIVSSEFRLGTLPQLKRAGITKADMIELLENMKDFMVYEYNDKKVFISHAGLATVPEFPMLLNNELYSYGFGGYSTDVDNYFLENHKDDNWYQVHGHRCLTQKNNTKGLKSFSLESKVEFGGYLANLTLDENGFKFIHVPNSIFKEDYQHAGNPKSKFKGKDIDNAVKDLVEKVESRLNGFNFIAKLRESDLIKEKELANNVASFNFTREAFFKKLFHEDIVTQARGLFIDTKTGEIVGRSYNKFFNINEKGVPDSQECAIINNFEGKISTFKKENGFLGITGYHSKIDELFIASKSTNTGDFADNFACILKDALGEDGLFKLKIQLRMQNASAIFEVNDPVNDPHMIKYEKAHVVLLDVVKRDVKFSKIDYDALVKFGESLGIPVKEKGPVFSNVVEFLKFNNAVSNENPILTSKRHEGYVAESDNGEMVKIKLPYYNFWKIMRSCKDKLSRNIVKMGVAPQVKPLRIESLLDNEFIHQDAKEFARSFLEYSMDKYGSDMLGHDIISLREEYEGTLPEKLVITKRNKINKPI